MLTKFLPSRASIYFEQVGDRDRIRPVTRRPLPARAMRRPSVCLSTEKHQTQAERKPVTCRCHAN